MSLLLCNYRGILPSFLLELLWLHFWHLTCESICKLSSILLQMAVPLSQYILLMAPSFPVGLRCPNGLSHAKCERKRVASQKLLPEVLYYSAFLCPSHMPTQDLSNPNPRLVFLPAQDARQLLLRTSGGKKVDGLCSLQADAAGQVLWSPPKHQAW